MRSLMSMLWHETPHVTTWQKESHSDADLVIILEYSLEQGGHTSTTRFKDFSEASRCVWIELVTQAYDGLSNYEHSQFALWEI